MKFKAPFCLATLLLPAVLRAGDVPADKSAYSLFNRTPASQLRELSTDRPDLPESAYTVDAGRRQAATDMAAYPHARDTLDGADTKTTSVSYANMNVKVGLTSNVDLQTVFSAYTVDRENDRIAGTRD